MPWQEEVINTDLVASDSLLVLVSLLCSRLLKYHIMQPNYRAEYKNTSIDNEKND